MKTATFKWAIGEFFFIFYFKKVLKFKTRGHFRIYDDLWGQMVNLRKILWSK